MKLTLTNMIIGMLIVSGAGLTVYGMLGQLASASYYDVDVGQDYSATFDKIDEISKDFNQTKGGLERITTEKDSGFFTGIADLFVGAKDLLFGTGAGITGSLGLGLTFVSDFTNSMSEFLPAWVELFLYAIVLVLVVGIIYRIFSGGKEL